MATPSRHVKNISSVHENDISHNLRVKFIIDEHGEKRLLQLIVANRPMWRESGYVTEHGTEDASDRNIPRLTRDELQKMSSAELREYVSKFADAQKDREKQAASDAAADLAGEKDYAYDAEKIRKDNFLRASRRAKVKVRDYVMAEYDFRYFVTLTLNGVDFARDDVETATKKLTTWLNNAVQRKGLKYILVPEYHHDRKSIHWHGFINNALQIVESGTYVPPCGGKPRKASTIRKMGYDLDECQTVYNLPEWPFGFTTAIEMYGDRAAAANYIAKYITKEFEQAATGGPIGKRYYLHSTNLRTVCYIYGDGMYDEMDGYEIETPGCSMKVQSLITEICNTEEEKEETWCGATKKEWTELYESASTE